MPIKWATRRRLRPPREWAPNMKPVFGMADAGHQIHFGAPDPQSDKVRGRSTKSLPQRERWPKLREMQWW